MQKLCLMITTPAGTILQQIGFYYIIKLFPPRGSFAYRYREKNGNERPVGPFDSYERSKQTHGGHSKKTNTVHTPPTATPLNLIGVGLPSYLWENRFCVLFALMPSPTRSIGTALRWYLRENRKPPTVWLCGVLWKTPNRNKCSWGTWWSFRNNFLVGYRCYVLPESTRFLHLSSKKSMKRTVSIFSTTS